MPDGRTVDETERPGGMNVLHLYDGHERVYGGRGSVPNVVWQIARHTAAGGHVVTVVERQWTGLPTVAEHEGVRFRRLPLSTGASEPWERVPYEEVTSPVGLSKLVIDRTNFARAAYPHVRDLDFDVLHVHLPFAANVLAAVAPWLRRRMVYTAHLGELRLDALSEDQERTDARVAADGDGTTADGTESFTPPAVVRRLSPDVYLARRAARTTVLNPDVERTFVENGVPASKLRVIPNGVDVDRFTNTDPAAVERLRDRYAPGGGPVVLFVGTVMPRKGVDDLVRAADRLVNEYGHGDLRVVIAGEDDLDGDYVDHVRGLAREAGIDDRVRFAGFVPDADLPALYHLADVFAMPSREEGFGMTITEAMAAGTPVVATNTGGIPRQVDHGRQGLLVAPNDAAALADALDGLLSDPDERGRMGDRARNRAETFSWPTIAGEFTALYREVNGES